MVVVASVLVVVDSEVEVLELVEVLVDSVDEVLVLVDEVDVEVLLVLVEEVVDVEVVVAEGGVKVMSRVGRLAARPADLEPNTKETLPPRRISHS